MSTECPINFKTMRAKGHFVGESAQLRLVCRRTEADGTLYVGELLRCRHRITVR